MFSIDTCLSCHYQGQNILDLLGDLGPTPVIPTKPEPSKSSGANDLLDLLGDVANAAASGKCHGCQYFMQILCLHLCVNGKLNIQYSCVL